MLKRLVLAAFLTAGIVAAWFLLIDPSVWDKGGGNREKDSPPAAGASSSPNSGMFNATAPADTDSSGLSLTLKTISLSQGEGGLELWRLRAGWASMEKKDGKIFVEQPKLVYLMPPDNRELHVTGDRGDIDQKEQTLRFVGNVFAAQDNSTVRGPLLIYNGTAKNMAFPQGGQFSGKGASGSAPYIVWGMKTNTIQASGGVEILFEDTPEPFKPREPQTPEEAQSAPAK